MGFKGGDEMKNDIKKISPEDLLQELINRKVLTSIEVGLYKTFELKRKYSRKPMPNFSTVYLLNA